MITFKNYEEIDHIVWIPTIPRSRSSMTAGILARSGAFFGKVSSGKHNDRGLYENVIVNNACWGERIKDSGGLKGLFKLSKVNSVPEDKDFKDIFTVLMNHHGYKKGQTAVFKHAPFMLFHKEIMECFPNSTWLIPDRNKEDRLDSMFKIFKLSMEEIEFIDSVYSEVQNEIEKSYPLNTYRINTDHIAKDGRFANIEDMVHKTPGLKWNEVQIKKWVSARSPATRRRKEY